MSIYQHNIDTHKHNPANSESINIVDAYCDEGCPKQDYDDQAFCKECGGWIIYVDDGGNKYKYERWNDSYDRF